MKTWQLIFIRLYMVTFGRLPAGAQLFRGALEYLLVRGKGRKGYHASSGFFDINDLD